MTANPGVEHPTIWICASYWKAPLRLRQVVTPVKGTMKPLDEFLPNGALLLHEYTHAWFASKSDRVDDDFALNFPIY